MKYYRTSDAAVVDISPEKFAALAPVKQAVHRPYSVDAVPAVTSTQRVEAGPVIVTETTATKTWTIVQKTQAELDAETESAQRAIDYTQARAVLLDLRNGTGTAAERLARLEKIVWRLARDATRVI